MSLTDIDRFGTVVVLGSWYGNMALLLKLEPISFDKLVMVDLDKNCIDFSRLVFSAIGNGFVAKTMDANEFDYSLLSLPFLVINTSCNDMDQRGWYDNIPPGAMVALQSRSDHEDLDSMDKKYPMSSIFYLGSRSFEDPTEKYLRFSKVGRK